jgi:hypothetical protein
MPTSEFPQVTGAIHDSEGGRAAMTKIDRRVARLDASRHIIAERRWRRTWVIVTQAAMPRLRPARRLDRAGVASRIY